MMELYNNKGLTSLHPGRVSLQAHHWISFQVLGQLHSYPMGLDLGVKRNSNTHSYHDFSRYIIGGNKSSR